MAPRNEYAVASVVSASVVSDNETEILIEAGGVAAMRYFLAHGARPYHEEDAGEPPSKKRKLGAEKSLTCTYPDPAQHIPISRVVLDLHFPESLYAGPVDPDEIAADVDFAGAESIKVVPSMVALFENGTKLRLALPRKEGAILVAECLDLPDNMVATIQKEFSARLKQPGDLRSQASDAPASWCRCTLTPSSGHHAVVRLEATTFWQSGWSAFEAGVPTGKARIYPDYNLLAEAFPDKAREAGGPMQDWTPQDFYENVHVPDAGLDTRKDFNGLLESDLYPFQKRAVHWMLGREGVRYENGELQSLHIARRHREVNLSQPFEDVHGDKCYVNHLQGVIVRSRPVDGEIQLSGGILAEEMGLGKTVELMALLSAHRRPEPHTKPFVDAETGVEVTPSKATLIITPNSILQQWKSELMHHAPALKVMYYEGFSSKKSQAERQLIEDMATKYDVVITTYSTLTRELHFAEDPPDRDMRHARKYERKRSPLVRVQFWRVCLDEAQMVESGVSAAARVARRLPRVNSWAVSGTPLRKNVQDLHGLLIFLGYHPFSGDAKLWSHLITNHKHLFRRIFSTIALRHTKAQIREDLQLPQQKRIVITMPFTPVEQENYSTLFAEMCEAVGVNADGSPRDEDWNPQDASTVEGMRDWLSRLRQSCLHPQVGGKNRRALGRGKGPVRTVAEVLEVMIDQNETELRVQERALLGTQVLRAHIVGNAREHDRRSEAALNIYRPAMERTGELVSATRKRLAEERRHQVEKGEAVDTDEDDSSTESTPALGRLRNNLRTFLQLQHACTFFTATACFQIKTNIDITEPETERYRKFEEDETALYESAKLLRKEILKDSSRKAEILMRKINTLVENDAFTKMPIIKALEGLGGIESRRVVEKADELFDKIREQSKVISGWRAKMADYLLKPLVDKESEEITGDEYEDSTKLQDELYAYFDAVKAMQWDINTFITGEKAPLIDYEVKTAFKAAKNFLDKDIVADVKTQVHAPELTLELLGIRNKLRGNINDYHSVRGLIQECRGIESSLQGHESGFRAAERVFMQRHMIALQKILSAYTKALAALEKEIELFRQTQNQRLEFYRQLQELSDAVQPYKEDLDPELDTKALNEAIEAEAKHAAAVKRLTGKNTFLHRLRTEDNEWTQEGEKTCGICTYPIVSAVLTTCGHACCRECILNWFKIKRTCPVCRAELSMADLQNVTYRPMAPRAKEEVQLGSSSQADSTPLSRQTSIYSDVDSQLLQQIKSIDLPASYGTKIDSLGKHLHWIREHDPGAKSIVFSQYREFLNVLSTALRDFKIGLCRLGQGGALEKFKRDPSIDCLLLDAKTDASGMTLVNATHVFICEPLINPAVELQAIARVHRIGQTRPTTVWMYIVENTVEDSIYEISVARRLAHVQARQSNRAQKSRSATPGPLQENAIDAANSEEMQSAALSKLLAPGKGGGELVGRDDLWQCLFGKVPKTAIDADMEDVPLVARYRRAEAAEGRRGGATEVD